jgi:hypothetical protein
MENGSANNGTFNPNGRLNPLNPNDARQFAREFADRRQAAQNLRDGLRRQNPNLSTAELDKAIEQLAKLQESGVSGDPASLDRLQADVIEGLKQFEFSLFKQLGIASAKQPATGTRADMPPEYKSLIEEYYRAISKKQ